MQCLVISPLVARDVGSNFKLVALACGPESDQLMKLIVMLLALQILTNDIYKSVEHRVVVNGERSRYSVATFYDPAKTRLISPAKPLVDKDRPALFPSILFGEHVATWYSKGPDGKKNIDSLVIE